MASPLPPGGKLSALWKKFALSTALATSVVAGWNGPAPAAPPATAAAGVQGIAQLLRDDDALGAQNAADAPDTVTPAPAPPDSAAAPVLSREEQARKLLVQEARSHFAQLAPIAETSYSRGLERLEQRLTALVRADDGSLQERVVILDPYRFDAAAVLSSSPADALRLLLSAQHATVPESRLAEIADHMADSYVNRVTADAYGQDPAAFPSAAISPRRACVIVPINTYNQPLSIPGLSLDQRINFINRHEGWHCQDSRFPQPPGGSGEEKMTKLDVNAAIADDALLADLSNRIRKESVADAGAVGDMIRQDGFGLDLIDKIIAWRNNPQDVGHISTPVLQGLKSAITKMGLPAFRALTDRQATDLYYNVTTQNQLGPNGVRFAMVLDNVTPAQRDDMAKQFAGDPEYQKAIALRRIYSRPVPDAGLFGGPLTAEEKRLMNEVSGWNASKLLQDTAFQRERKITPVTLIAAYATLQEGLMARLHAEPDNSLLPVLMTKLQNTFMHDVRSLDYLKVNAARGVNLAKTEPALAHLGPQRPPRGTPMAAGPSALRVN